MTAAAERLRTCDLLASYLLAKVAVVEAGFEQEITWQEERCLHRVDERLFLREAAWVVLSSGMRETVIRKVFPGVEAAFGEWRSGAWIVEHAPHCRESALKLFGHAPKIDALIDISTRVALCGIKPLLSDLRARGPGALEELPYMGPATSRHLAKNLGLDVAKPDRHLVRVAEVTGHSSVGSLCEQLAELVGDTVAVVDLVIWRFATITEDYLGFFRQRRCPGGQRQRGRLTDDVHGPGCWAG